jgi:hypothetical protein
MYVSNIINTTRFTTFGFEKEPERVVGPQDFASELYEGNQTNEPLSGPAFLTIESKA